MFTMNWGEISLAVRENISDLKHFNALVKCDRRRVEQTEICKIVEKKTAPFCRKCWRRISLGADLVFVCKYNFQIMLLIQYLKVSCKCQNIPEVEVLVFVRAWDCKPADFGELSWCHFRKRKLARGGHVLELGWWVKMESRSYVNSGVAPPLTWNYYSAADSSFAVRTCLCRGTVWELFDSCENLRSRRNPGTSLPWVTYHGEEEGEL